LGAYGKGECHHSLALPGFGAQQYLATIRAGKFAPNERYDSMKLQLALVLATCSLLASDAVCAEGDALQGAWVIESFEAMGKKMDNLKGGVFTFADGKVTMKMDEQETPGTYKIDAGKSPKQINLTSKGPGGKDATAEAIFKIDGDTLTICMGLGTSKTEKRADGTGSERVITQDPRPTAFDSKQGALIVYKRKK